MRELVYLSDRKLRQFMPERRRSLGRRGWQVTTPVGGVGIEAGAPDAEREREKRLRRIVDHVSVSARWFTEPEVRAGAWVEFEAPLNYRALNGAAPGMVLFFDPATAVEGYESGGALRLVLHGSVAHLAGDLEPTVAEPPALAERGWDGGISSCGPSWVQLATHAATLLGALAVQPSAASEPGHAPDSPLTLAEGTRQVLAALDGQLPAETAAWMHGHARVTAAVPAPGGERVRYLVATPLYVEYVTP
ncbi:SAVMC3_10250 family protein [Streptomyces spectabilis]|uniref:Uncharacterized protein n=1 Tax=Streptomyces spectabilis TaxID=68270 RepID=A0A5P2X8X8_STRST|nr:SAVMC3_10250 family protein [Streptomyces spectabilis]MBB5103036.1 hypothetical protein [Streptomyces spectabilis]MCI3902231.1 hypothetical protein [Streptomyces spectabilis]QEV59605.1 hypothetical protein CP982_13395 [Streptomyces spectabilis]GGV15163.1 hypothetical protein GCM10010245_26290 [Streptomyces spectabilis]